MESRATTESLSSDNEDVILCVLHLFFYDNINLSDCKQTAYIRYTRTFTVFWQIGRSAAPASTALQRLFFSRLRLAVLVGWGAESNHRVLP